MTATNRRRQRAVDIGEPARCYYAADVVGRPGCQLTAVVAYGSVALCGSCAGQRSTLGKGQAGVRLSAGRPVDVLDWISAAHAELLAAQRILAAAVVRAREHGQCWSAIGERLGISRQAAQQRFGVTATVPTSAPAVRRPS